MTIKIEILKEVINSHVTDILRDLEGKNELIIPRISKYEAIDRLGLISSIVISLHDKVENQPLKDEIWELKNKSDKSIKKLLSLNEME